MPAAQSSTLPDRRILAVGILSRTAAGRTILTVRTADGTTGTITSRCPDCRCPFEECTCTGGTLLVPSQQTFDDDADDACPLCGNWTCSCPTQGARRRELAVA
ncbi:hypothetical protein OG233_14020 [Streptomyces sp. NBC_01218]|uniref:hypothetical protein n=1 Tax=Streptomyces sp. NBC_01218 TaxID=2903780 RepID=UPI002E0DCD6F|nr:hypothetical protein OG233_14020 [Streptomyces sp. NBC_01218]